MNWGMHMCEYCEGWYSLVPRYSTGDLIYIDVHIENNELFIDNGLGDESVISIKYCPMCSNELKTSRDNN